MNEASRALAAKRIVTLIRYEALGDWTVHSAALEMSKQGFFSLLRRWRKNRSLLAVVPRLAAESGGPSGNGVTCAHRRLAVRLTKEEPDWAREKIVDEVRRLSNSKPSERALRALIDRIELKLERKDLGPRAFLSKIAVGTCPVVLRHFDTVGWRPTAYVGLVLDVSTGKVLGWAAEGFETKAFAQAALAAADAVEAIPSSREVGNARIECYISGEPLEILREFARLSSLPVRLETEDPYDGRRRGFRMVQLLGSRLGAFDLRPRAEVPTPTLLDSERGGFTAAQIVTALLDDEMAELRPGRSDDTASSAVDTVALAALLREIAGQTGRT